MGEGRPSIASRRRRSARIALVWAGVVGLVAVVAATSLLVGSSEVSPGTVWTAVVSFDPTDYDHLVVRTSRLPRLAFGLVVGAALGAAGCLMQATTRNPLADTGLLGVNSGAIFAVTVGYVLFGRLGSGATMGAAFVGALAVTVVVLLLAGGGRHGPSPTTLVLGGAAVAALLGGVVSALTLLDRELFAHMLLWGIGSITYQPIEELAGLGPFVAVGLALAVVVAPGVDMLGLGDDLASSLGARTRLVRAGSVLTIATLAGASTALIGPLGFVGLVVPHVAKRLGPRALRPVLVLSALLGAALVVVADTAGRLAPLGEVPVGLVLPVVGAPVLIVLARRLRGETW